MCELLIGYRQPDLAILAHTLRPNITGIQLTNMFRDETLASIPDLERAAFQCFSLAHEVGHLLIPKRKNVTLNVIVDGLSLAQHFRTQEEEEGAVPNEVAATLADIRERKIDATNLLNEIEVDLFAFGTVVDFLCRTFTCPVGMAVDATLLSVECQSFIYSCKRTCQLLSDVAAAGLGEEDFIRLDYVNGVELVARARAVVRRAGFVWAVAEHPSPPTGGRDYNAYVKKVDALLRPTVGFRALMDNVLHEQVCTLVAALAENAGPRRDLWFDSLLSLLKEDSELRLDLAKVLSAFGLPWVIDPVSYFRQLRSTSPVG